MLHCCRRCCRCRRHRRGRCLSQAALPVPGRRIIWRSEAANCGAPSFIYICSLSPLEPRQSALAPSTINRHALFTIIITEPHARCAQPPQPAAPRTPRRPAHTPPDSSPARSPAHPRTHSLTPSLADWLALPFFFFFVFLGVLVAFSVVCLVCFATRLLFVNSYLQSSNPLPSFPIPSPLLATSTSLMPLQKAESRRLS